MNETVSNKPSAAKKRAPGWWYPYIFVAFFAVIVTVNGIMMYFAFDSWTGLETKDHYVKGLAYDDLIAAQKEQEKLGWDVSLKITDVHANGDVRTINFAVTFLDHNKKPVQGLKARAYLVRPIGDKVDFSVPADETAPGVMTGRAALPLPGQWDLRMYAQSQGRNYQFVERIVVK